MVRFLDGSCLFPLFQIWFLDWFKGLRSFWGGCYVGGFCSFGVAVGGLHFHEFCHSKYFENILRSNILL